MKRRSAFIALVTLAAFTPVAIISNAAAAAAQTAAKPAKPAHIAKGEKVNITDYLVPGKTVIFDFYSDYCGPCVQVAPMLEKLHQSRADVVVVKVDINRPGGPKTIDWHSPVAQQYRLQSIPHFKVYGPDGKLKAEDGPNSNAARQIVMSMING